MSVTLLNLLFKMTVSLDMFTIPSLNQFVRTRAEEGKNINFVRINVLPRFTIF